jgi:hypothetical protein
MSNAMPQAKVAPSSSHDFSVFIELSPQYVGYILHMATPRSDCIDNRIARYSRAPAEMHSGT